MDFLGDRIRYLRESAGLKQKDMAFEFSLNENTWSQYETNKRTPDIDTIKKIAEYFHVSIEYLMGLTDVQYNPKEEEFKEMVHIYYSLSKDEKRELIKELKQKYAGKRR